MELIALMLTIFWILAGCGTVSGIVSARSVIEEEYKPPSLIVMCIVIALWPFAFFGTITEAAIVYTGRE